MSLYKKSVRIGDLLLDLGKITIEQLDDALMIQKKSKQKLGQILVEKGYFKEDELLNILSKQMNIEKINLNTYPVDLEVVNKISQSLARKYESIPIAMSNNCIIVAMNDPMDIYAIEDIEMTTGYKVEPKLASKQVILNSIDRYYSKSQAENAANEFIKENIKYDNEDIDESLLNDLNNAPVVRLVDTIIRQALKFGSSDIHIEPFENIVRIRYRIDGQLIEMMSPSKDIHSALVTRIKIMANLNIAEKRLPQDGRIETRIDNLALDLRISILPTMYGEKVVIRILDRNSFLKSKKELGFTDSNCEIFDEILKVPNGIILITGPTGSGKTTTLYTALNELNDVKKNIITVEDPVEYKLMGVNQVQVNAKIGLSFATGLRSILRQDPDIIMIGEIRDKETAEIAVRAAITGHLVISTIHTNDAPSTITRLVDMEIPQYLITSSVRGIVAQRLVRKICPYCKQKYSATEEEKHILGIDEKQDVQLYRGVGCPACHNTGYSGRTAIHEIMKMTKKLRQFIYKNEFTSDEIRDEAMKEGFSSLMENCKILVLTGSTTIDEFIKIGYNFD